MANRKFFSDINPTDITIQSEDGGGIKFTQQGKFIFGAKQQNIIDQLNQENYQGTVDVNPNEQSYIAIMNDNSTNVDVEIGNKNQFSLFEPVNNNIVTTTQNISPITTTQTPTQTEELPEEETPPPPPPPTSPPQPQNNQPKNIVEFGYQLQKEGYRVSENPFFGGVTPDEHKGRGHYEGRAIDVNIRYGINEATHPKWGPDFDKLAVRARNLGFIVLWRVEGHYDHMHIEEPEGGIKGKPLPPEVTVFEEETGDTIPEDNLEGIYDANFLPNNESVENEYEEEEGGIPKEENDKILKQQGQK